MFSRQTVLSPSNSHLYGELCFDAKVYFRSRKFVEEKKIKFSTKQDDIKGNNYLESINLLNVLISKKKKNKRCFITRNGQMMCVIVVRVNTAQ